MSGAKTKVKLRRAAVSSEILKSAGARAAVMAVAQGVAARASSMGDGAYEAEEGAGKNRAWARVHAADAPAYYGCRKHNTLLKALGGGG